MNFICQSGITPNAVSAHVGTVVVLTNSRIMIIKRLSYGS